MENNTNDTNKEMQENENNQTSKRKILNLMKELANIRLHSGALGIKMNAIEGKNLVSEKYTQMKDNIQEKAKMYGKQAREMAENYANNKDSKNNVLQQYRESLEAIVKEYENAIQEVMKEGEFYQDKEEIAMIDELNLKDERREIKKSTEYKEQMQQEKDLKREIKQALEQRDLTTVTSKTKELETLQEKNPLLKCEKKIEEAQQIRKSLKEAMKLCNQEIKVLQNNRDKSINEATVDKDNKLEPIKQNIFQRAVGALFNKINGAKKFTKNVIDKVQETIYDINNNKLPAVREKVGEKVEELSEVINEKAIDISDKGKEIIEKGKGNLDQLKQNAKETKEKMMQEAESKLIESIEKHKQIYNQRSMDYAEMTASNTEEGR